MTTSKTWLRLAVSLAGLFAPMELSAAGDAAAVAEGARLFREQCAACHATSEAGAGDWEALAALPGPDLSTAGSRFRREWLAQWLVEPERFRPAGFLPFRHTVVTADGDKIDRGSLPPHPTLDAPSAAAVADFLASLQAPEVPYPIAEPSAAIRPEVQFHKILPCGACHRSAEGQGGVSAPDLGGASRRLRPEWLRSVTWDPRSRGSLLMPRVPLRADQLATLAAYLEASPSEDGDPTLPYLAAGEEATAAPPPGGQAETIYRVLCSTCHGLAGNGRGINASFLFISPRDHTSFEEMSRLSDGAIATAIERGGVAVGKSALMPAWGSILDQEEIELLVAYLRRLSGSGGSRK